MRKLSSQPARFSLPRMEPLPGSSRARFQRQFAQQGQVFRTMPLTVPCLVFVTGYVQYQCSRFSIPQWPRTMSLHRSGGQAWLSR